MATVVTTKCLMPSVHVMNLHNGWQEKIEHFNEYAYMEIEKMDTIDSMPVSLDKNGDFVNKN